MKYVRERHADANMTRSKRAAGRAPFFLAPTNRNDNLKLFGVSVLVLSLFFMFGIVLEYNRYQW